METIEENEEISRSCCEIQELKLFPLEDEFIGVLNLAKLPLKLSKIKCETVIILDRSGSMGDNVEYITNIVLPAFFEQLSYKADDVIHLITFDNKYEYFKLSVGELSSLGIGCRGCTSMSPAISELQKLMTAFIKDKVEAVRIFTISDGEIDDQEHTAQLSDELSKVLKESKLLINSQAVRFFTSTYGQPDTTALCCLLQLNNVTPSNLLDMSSEVQIDIIVEKWIELFANDGLVNAVELQCDAQIIRRNPWDPQSSDRLRLTVGSNIFWVKDVPESVSINDNHVEVSIQPPMSYEKFHAILNKKLNFFMDQVKILKIIQTDAGRETITNMVEYFKRVEKCLPSSIAIEEPKDKNSLSSRTSFFKINAYNQRKISNVLAEIANDDMVGNLNAAQKADYLRSTTTSKNSRSLAKRSAKATGNENFDEIARKEVLEIVNHFNEIKDINYRNHAVSFYSQATTMEGLETLVDFSKDEYFETMDVFEIIKLMNIVGVACSGPIGDYPDASTWRINKIFPGCFISLSDLMYVLDQSASNTLKPPGFDEEITNAIPVFDDPRIAKFLKKYAPSLLEFTFSIGMRRMIAEVPMTITYTMIAGIRGIIPVIDKDKSSVNVEILSKLVSTLDSFAGKSPLQDLIKDQNPESTLNGFFLDNNGIADIIVPLIRIIKSNDENQLKKIPAILRSAFNYEIFNVIRKQYRGKDGENIVMLHKLLGVDIEKNKIKVEMPMDEENVKYYDQINLNIDFFTSLVENLGFTHSIALIPKYLKPVINNRVDDIANVPKLDEKLVLEVLGIDDCDFKDFMLLNVYQALRYTTKKERCNDEGKSMKILDLKNHREGTEEVRSYIRGVFEAEFKRDLSRAKGLVMKKDRLLKDSYFFEEKLTKELKRPKKYHYDVQADDLVMKILTTSSYNEMIKIWKDGIEVNEKSVRPSTVGSSATRLFVLAMRCLHFKIPMRAEILKILTTGKDKNGDVIWKNDTLKEGTVIAKYMKLVNIFCDTFPSECVKSVQQCC